MKCIAFLTGLLVCAVVTAQQTSGVVTYDETFQIEAEIETEGEEDQFEGLPPDIVEQIKAAMANVPSMKKQLVFSDKVSLMSDVKEEEKPTAPGNGGMVIMVMSDDDESIIHHDYSNQLVTEQHLFLDKKFLLKEAAPALEWKMTGQQKELLGHMVLEATAESDSSEVVAWFAPQIPVPTGPRGFGGLPGLILELSLDGGALTYTATDVAFRAVTEEEVLAPKKGKKMDKDAFNAMREERMLEMEGEGGGSRMEITIGN